MIARGPGAAMLMSVALATPACLDATPAPSDRDIVTVARPTPRLDLLMVIDNSSTMAREQSRLAGEVPRLVSRLAARGVSDLRIAVTSPDVMCDPDLSPGMVARGRFATRPMASANLTGRVAVSMACRDDADCAAGACDRLGCMSDDHARWQCERAQHDACVTMPNGSFGTRCTLRCASDDDCTTTLGPGFVCLVAPTGTSVCVEPLAPCPAEIPPVLAGDDLALAPCAMRIGVFKERCARFEQPLEAMRLAIDPSGPNPEQHAAFVRPDALLAVLAVSDEEDCSVRPGETFLETDADRCGALAPGDGAERLQTLDHYVAFLEGLKGPGRAFFAAVAGDSTAADPSVADAERAAYLDAMRHPRDCFVASSICMTPDGRDTADWAPRLFGMAQALAPDGLTANLCDGDWAPAFDRLADALADSASRVCLPRPPRPGLTVVRVVDRRETRLVEVASGSAPGTWRLVLDARECPSGAAIVAADPPAPGEELRFVYPRP